MVRSGLGERILCWRAFHRYVESSKSTYIAPVGDRGRRRSFRRFVAAACVLTSHPPVTIVPAGSCDRRDGNGHHARTSEGVHPAGIVDGPEQDCNIARAAGAAGYKARTRCGGRCCGSCGIARHNTPPGHHEGEDAGRAPEFQKGGVSVRSRHDEAGGDQDGKGYA